MMNFMILNYKYEPPIFMITNLYSKEKLTKKIYYPNILSILEEHKIFIEYQCRAGYCGSCRTKIIKGQVYYPNKPLAFINKNEILPCCAISKGNIELFIL